MNKKKKRWIRVLLIITIVALLGLVLYFSIGYKKTNSLSLDEKKWIDINKSNVIDIAAINDLPIISYNGEGLFYDYIDYIKNKYSLEFNVVYNEFDTESEYQYKMNIVNTPQYSDITLLSDNLILVTLDNKIYTNSSEIANLNIGIAESDVELLDSYTINDTNKFFKYTTYTELIDLYKKSIIDHESELNTTINAMIIPKDLFTKEILENNYQISYHFDNSVKYFVLSLGGDSRLNSIFKKTFNVWSDSNYQDSYNSNLLNNYYYLKNVSDYDKKKLQSKNYSYGFIDYGVFNSISNGKISGYNEVILKDFNNFSGLTITYTKFNSLSKLLDDFNTYKIDFMLNIYDPDFTESILYKTNKGINSKLVVISGSNNKLVIDDINALKGKEVLTVRNSRLEKMLMNIGAKIKSYNNLRDLTKDFSSNDIAIIDLENYNYYKSNLDDSKYNYLIGDTNYNYIINNNTDNDVFIDLFEFYLNYNSLNKIIAQNYSTSTASGVNYIYIFYIISAILLVYVVIDFNNHVKFLAKRIKKNKRLNLSKEDKIKYIDQLTSLKNRAYFNSRIESWDSSEIYPQAIIIIDLNNVSYINDNFGREEGDRVIAEAASILIQHQLQNTEIIRSDGNEFLIYMVGYNEKQIISYLRKLSKEFKDLSHGFGAASGYSIINDEIKTIDDAVNEATLEMRKYKEDIDY